MTPQEEEPAQGPPLSEDEGETARYVEHQLQLAENIGPEIGAGTARTIAAALSTTRNGALDTFAETGNLHRESALAELTDRTYDLLQIRWANALLAFLDAAGPEDYRPRIYLAPASGIGGWVDVAAPNLEVRQAVHALQQRHGLGEVAWTVHAYTGFFQLGIAPEEDLASLIEVAGGIHIHGEPYAAYAEYIGIPNAVTERFDQHYYACVESVTEFVFHVAEQRGWLQDIKALNASTGLDGLLSLDVEAVAARYFDSSVYGDWRCVPGEDGLHILCPADYPT